MPSFRYRVVAENDPNEGWAWDGEPERVYLVYRLALALPGKLRRFTGVEEGIIIKWRAARWTAYTPRGVFWEFRSRHDASLWLVGESIY